MLIGELAKASGASARMLRHYEDHGLIAAERSTSGYRVYGAGTVERVQLIRQLFSAGLSAPEVAEVLRPLLDQPGSGVALDQRLVRERDRLDQALRSMQRRRDALSAIIVSNAERQARVARALRQPTRRSPGQAPTSRG